MARSATQDPIEKFRFTITVIALDLSVSGALTTIGGVAGVNPFQVLTSAGFHEITLPKSVVNEISYRENIDSQRFSKGPGLVKYEPILLRRGVTKNRDLYDWYRQVNNDIFSLTVAREVVGNHITKTASQDVHFRKEVILKAWDREGNEVKQWLLLNAFPTSYKPGNDFSAQADEKLIEELTLTYETFLELEGGLSGFLKEIAKDAISGVVSIGVGTVANQFNPFGSGS